MRNNLLLLLFSLATVFTATAQDISIVAQPTVGTCKSQYGAGTLSVAALLPSSGCISSDVFMMSVPEELNPSGINIITTDDISMTIINGTITINGIDNTTSVKVYSIDGQLQHSNKGATIQMPDTHGVYIVKVAGITRKIVL